MGQAPIPSECVLIPSRDVHVYAIHHSGTVYAYLAVSPGFVMEMFGGTARIRLDIFILGSSGHVRGSKSRCFGI